MIKQRKKKMYYGEINNDEKTQTNFSNWRNESPDNQELDDK